MELSQLRSFCAVVEEESIGRGARRADVTQPAVSMQLKSLENDLEEILLERGRNRTTPTQAGSILYEHAQRALEELELARDKIAELHGLKRGRLRIGAGDTVSVHLLSPVLAGFVSEYPGIEVTVRNRTSPEIVQQLQSGELDVGLVTTPFSGESTLTLCPIRQVYVRAVCSPGHPLSSRRRIALDELVAHRLLLLEQGTQARALLNRDFAAAGVLPHSVMDVGSVDTQKEFARIGLGVALIPDFATDDTADTGLHQLTVSGLQRRQLSLVKAERSESRPAVAAFERMMAPIT